MLTEILQLEDPYNTNDFQCWQNKQTSKQTPSFSFDFCKLWSAVKGVLQHQSNSLCFPQNLKFRSHIDSPKSHMQKSMDKSRCKLWDLNWMVKQTNKTDVNMSSSQRPLAVHSKQLKCFLSLPGNGAPSSELFPTSIHLSQVFSSWAAFGLLCNT